MIRNLAVALPILLALGVPAASGIKGCYERVYEDAHMKAHKGQLVKRLRLQIGLETGSGTNEADLNGLDFWLRGETKPRYAIPICRETTEPLDCGLESDRGSFVLEETKDGVKLTNKSYLRAVDPDSEDEGGVELLPDSEHKFFLLRRIGKGRCPS